MSQPLPFVPPIPPDKVQDNPPFLTPDPLFVPSNVCADVSISEKDRSIKTLPVGQPVTLPIPSTRLLDPLPVTSRTQSPLPQASSNTAEPATLHPVKFDRPPQLATEMSSEPSAGQHSSDKEVSMDTEEIDDELLPGQVPPQLPCTSTASTVRPETSPSSVTDGRGGDRGGGRIPLHLPLGCEVFLTESGTENYICCCQKKFTEKKNLLRHYQACTSNKERSTSPTVQPGFKRRRSETGAESGKSVEGDTVDTAHFNEDPEGTKLMQCK